MLFRTTDMVLIAIMVGAAAFTYKVKQEAGRELSALRQIEAQIRLEEDSIDLLKADWSLLTQPKRLQQLSETFGEDLKLQPVEPTQYVRLSELPQRPLDIKDIISDSIHLMAGDDIDQTATGAIGQ